MFYDTIKDNIRPILSELSEIQLWNFNSSIYSQKLIIDLINQEDQK